MPDARRIDRILTGRKGRRLDDAVRQFLMEDQFAEETIDDFAADRMAIPTRPVLGEEILADEAAIRTVAAWRAA